jgi:hypothetical protein
VFKSEFINPERKKLYTRFKWTVSQDLLNHVSVVSAIAATIPFSSVSLKGVSPCVIPVNGNYSCVYFLEFVFKISNEENEIFSA